MKHRLIRSLSMALVLALSTSYCNATGALTRLTKNDPEPIFSTADPYSFLDICRRNDLKDNCENPPGPCVIRVAVSPFRQSAECGQNIDEEEVPLGDLTGRWNIGGLFYDPDKRFLLERDLGLDRAPTTTVCFDPVNNFNLLLDPEGKDPNDQFAFYSVPISYRKYGVRFQADIALVSDFTMTLLGGVSHIRQDPTFNDLTCAATGTGCAVRDCTNFTVSSGSGGSDSPSICPSDTCCPPINPIQPDTTPGEQTSCNTANCCIDVANCLCKTLVINRIMKSPQDLAEVVGQSVCQYDKTSFEDIELDINWSHLFLINPNSGEFCLPAFIFTPFWSVGVVFPTSNKICHNELFALPSGNDGHWAYGGRAGFTLDFLDSIAIGVEAGGTGFSARNIPKFPVPTDELQSGIYPELVTMRVKPGSNSMFAFYVSGYHFLCNLSAWVQYQFTGHSKDEFELCSVVDFPIECCTLRERSDWRFHAVNVALNYDLSKNMSIGIMWQIPVSQQNAYRSTTILGSLIIEY